jgi:hypothetical protein
VVADYVITADFVVAHHSILRTGHDADGMKGIFATAIALLAVNQWDQIFNDGTLTRVGFSLATQISRSFGL